MPQFTPRDQAHLVQASGLGVCLAFQGKMFHTRWLLTLYTNADPKLFVDCNDSNSL